MCCIKMLNPREIYHAQKIFANLRYSEDCRSFPDICKMHILLIAATEPELLPIADYLQERGYKIWNHRIQLSVTGVGLTSTAYFLTRLICETKPDLIIQAGIAGSFEPFDKPKVIAVTEDRFADMGVLENNRFIDVFSLQLVDGNKNPFIKGSLVNPYQQLLMLASCESGR